MTDVTNQEFIVTAHVNERFYGTSYSSYEYQGSTYYTFGQALNERWVDVDGDGWFDYGLRDEGGGNWSRFEGFYWDNDATPPPKFDDGTRPEEPTPDNNLVQVSDGLVSVWNDELNADSGLMALHPQTDAWFL